MVSVTFWVNIFALGLESNVCVFVLHEKKMAHSDTRLHISRLLVVSRGIFIYVWNELLSSPHSSNEQTSDTIHILPCKTAREKSYFDCCYIIIVVIIKFWHSFTSMYHVNILVYTLHTFRYICVCICIIGEHNETNHMSFTTIIHSHKSFMREESVLHKFTYL